MTLGYGVRRLKNYSNEIIFRIKQNAFVILLFK